MGFLDNPIVEAIISLMLIYALLSILVSILVEAVNRRRNSRGKMLKDAIHGLLKDPHNADYGYLFYNHRMVDGIRREKNMRLPQYISSGMFADVLIDVIAQQVEGEVELTRHQQEVVAANDENAHAVDDNTLRLFEKAIKKGMNSSTFRDLLVSFWSKTLKMEDHDPYGHEHYQRLKQAIEQWFNDHMDRATGWYKEAQSRKLLWAGFAVAIFLNVDSIFLFKVLTLDDDLRDEMVDVAEGVADDYEKLTEDEKREISKQIEVIQFQLDQRKADSHQSEVQVLIDTTTLNKVLEKLKAHNAELDSQLLEHYNNAKEVVQMASELGVPVGWNESYAPLSWFKSKDQQKTAVNDLFQKQIKKVEREENLRINDLEKYLRRRNFHPNFWDVLFYFLGVIVSGFSLSFGAPFWFDALSKLVNIRRSGIKPPTQKTEA